MATFRSIKELTRALQQGTKLLSNMFLQRKTIAVKYDDALETLDGDENKLKLLITYGVIVQTGDSLELDDAYQRFFEEVLAVNEDINISSVKMYIDRLNLGINQAVVMLQVAGIHSEQQLALQPMRFHHISCLSKVFFINHFHKQTTLAP